MRIKRAIIGVLVRLIAYLGVLASIILGGILGLFGSVLVLATLDVTISHVHVLIIGIALGAFIGGALAVIRVRRYLRKLREKKLAKYLTSVPENASELIKAVIKKMRYRKKVRAEVAQELTGHFEDELRDCKSDEEKEQKGEQLIEDFGDVKLLAVLLRRAKKRCRPLWRTIVARTFQAVGVLILCFIVYTIWFLTGKPVITVDYVAELNRIVRPVADDSLNAAPLYHKAAELSEKSSDDFLLFFAENFEETLARKKPPRDKSIVLEISKLFERRNWIDYPERRLAVQRRVNNEIFELLSKKYNELTDEQKRLIEKWLTDNEETLELVIAGTQKPYYWQKYEGGEEGEGVISVLMPSLAGFRTLAYSLRWRAHLRAEQGRYEDAFVDMKACYRFGRHLRGDKSLIEQLVGIVIDALAAQTLRDILSEHRIDSPVLAQLQQGFEKMIADEDSTVSFKFEKLTMYDEIQRCFTEDRLGGGHISLEGLKRLQIFEALMGSADYDLFDEFWPLWTKSLHVLFTHPNKQESREMADRCYAFWEEIARKSPAQIRAEGIDIEKETMEIVKGNILLEILTPAIGRICEIAHRNKIDVNATLAIIAVLRYKQDVGDYPENLDELIEAGLLKALPIDPYSDKPLVYKKADNNFVLYGFGPNFKDDGGTVAVVDGRTRKWGSKDEGDWVFWPVQKK